MYVAVNLPTNDSSHTSQVTSVAGSSAVLPCHTALSESVLWSKYNASASRPFSDIYVSNRIINGFVGRFTVETSPAGHYDLVIANITMSDSGLYVCIEGNGLEANHYIRLTVKGEVRVHKL